MLGIISRNTGWSSERHSEAPERGWTEEESSLKLEQYRMRLDSRIDDADVQMMPSSFSGFPWRKQYVLKSTSRQERWRHTKTLSGSWGLRAKKHQTAAQFWTPALAPVPPVTGQLVPPQPILWLDSLVIRSVFYLCVINHTAAQYFPIMLKEPPNGILIYQPVIVFFI